MAEVFAFIIILLLIGGSALAYGMWQHKVTRYRRRSVPSVTQQIVGEDSPLLRRAHEELGNQEARLQQGKDAEHQQLCQQATQMVNNILQVANKKATYGWESVDPREYGDNRESVKTTIDGLTFFYGFHPYDHRLALSHQRVRWLYLGALDVTMHVTHLADVARLVKERPKQASR